jgi:hypothetical protein
VFRLVVSNPVNLRILASYLNPFPIFGIGENLWFNFPSPISSRNPKRRVHRLIRLPSDRSLRLKLVRFDRPLGVRTKNSVSLSGIDSHALQGALYGTDFVVTELEIVPVGRIGPLNKLIMVDQFLLWRR